MQFLTSVDQTAYEVIKNDSYVGFGNIVPSKHPSFHSLSNFNSYGKASRQRAQFKLFDNYTTEAYHHHHPYKQQSSYTSAARHQEPSFQNGSSPLSSQPEALVLDRPIMSTSLYDGEQVIEGRGDANIELSPHQLSLEKRRIMLRKLSYGRADELRAALAKRVNGLKRNSGGDFSVPLATRWDDFFGEVRVG